MHETGIQFGPSRRLIGVLNDASGAATKASKLGLVLLNAGLVHRVGPHRINVKIARLAASHGVPSLRFDLSGRGDSGPGELDKDFHAQAVSDLRQAMSEIDSRLGPREYMVFGICSGADDGYDAALEDSRISSLVMFDPYVFPTLRWQIRLNLARLRKFGLSGGMRLLLERKGARSGAEEPALRNFGREVPPVARFAAGLRALSDRQVDVRLIYSGSAVDRRDFEDQRKLLMDRHGLNGKLSLEFIPEIDHIVTSILAQKLLLERFNDWLSALVANP
jgi:hypothetical protein